MYTYCLYYYPPTAPKRPTIAIEGCDGDKPIVRVTRPPNFNGLVKLNYTITLNDTASGMTSGDDSGSDATSGQVGDGLSEPT